MDDKIREQKYSDALEEFLKKSPDLNLTKDVLILNAYNPRGIGGFSDVCQGERQSDGTKVAIKFVRSYSNDKLGVFLKSICKETRIWSSLAHDNILPFLGYIFTDRSEYPSFISPWMDNGDVLHYVKEHPSVNLVHFVLGIAKGLGYLHDMANIIHSDLKSANIIISPEGIPLLMDFGISHVMVSSSAEFFSISSSVKGSIRWMARELLVGSEESEQPEDERIVHTKESDIWALGMVIYDTGDLNEAISLPQASHTGANFRRDLYEVLPVFPQDINSIGGKFLESLSQECWDFDPKRRPSANEIVIKLHEYSAS